MGEGIFSAHDGGTALEQSGGAQGGGDQNGIEYRNLIVEIDGDGEELALWDRSWLGRILVLRVPGGLIYIGPHWYCSVIMLSFILGVGGYFCSSVIQAGAMQLLGGITVTVLSTATFLRCALSNPGVLKAQPRGAPGGLPPSEGSHGGNAGSVKRCEKCNVTQPRGCSHCEFCQVCVEGFDHHCPWMGKCIGRQNLVAFYMFICISFSSLGYIFLCTVMSAGMGEPRSSAAAWRNRT